MKRRIMLRVAMALAMLVAASPALAMTQERAEALVRQADKNAAKAKQFWVYPEGDGAWVFYGTGYSSPLFKGAFWYVTEEAQTPLGDYTENVYEWDYFTSEPPVFYADTIYGAARDHHLHAAILKDGAPFEIRDLGMLTDLDGYDGSLVGRADPDIVNAHPYWIFLGVQGDKLVEIAAVRIGEANARRISGMSEIIDTLAYGDDSNPNNPGGVTVNEYLFRNAVPGKFRNAKGNIQGSVTLSVSDNGKPGRVYVFIDEDGVAHPERGWENEIVIWDDEPAARADVGLEIVKTVIEEDWE